MLRLWYIFFLSATTIVANHACDAYVTNMTNLETLEDDNNVISPETPPTRSFTSYVPQCWSYRDYSFGRNEHFKSHFHVVILRGGQFKVEYERGETCGVVRIVCLRAISNTTVNDPRVDINTCDTNKMTSFNISIDTGECIPAVQCQNKALYDTKIFLTLSKNDYRPLSVFSLNGEELQYDGAALAEGRRTQALLTELDVRKYKDRADALHYASTVDLLLDEYDNMAGIDKSGYRCLEIQAWRSGPGGAPAANLPICPTVFLRAVPYSGVYGYKSHDHLAVNNDKGVVDEFLTSNPATSWLLLHEVAHVYDAFTTDSHLKQHLREVWNNVLAGLYQARYSHTNDSYWLYKESAEVKNTLEILKSDVAFEDLDGRERAHVFIGLLNVDDDSSYLADLYKRYYSTDRVNYVLEELVSMYLNRRVDPLPLMARVFSAERGNWFNITQFAQAISLNRRLSYDKDLNTYPKSVFSVTSAPVNLKTNVSFSPEDCGTPFFTIDGILFNTTTVVTRANSLVVCLDTPNIRNSITKLTKFIYLTDINVKENIVINPVRAMASEGLKFLGFSNTWGHLDMRHDENKLVFETYNIQPHSRFDTVYADFTFFKENDEVMWQVSIKGTEAHKRHKELILNEVKKIQIYYAEPSKLKYTRTKQALTRKKNSTFILHSPDSRNDIVFNPPHIMTASEGFAFWGYGHIWGSLDLRYDINKLVFETYNVQPHSRFDTVYAYFTFFKENDEVMWQVSVKGTEGQERHKELILTEVKKIQIYYAEPEKLKYTRTKQALTRKKNSTFILNSPDSRNDIVFNPLHIMAASEGFTFWGYGHIWGSLDLRYDINKLIFETYDVQPHSRFDTVYAYFTFFKENDEVMWQVSVKGTEGQERYKELILTEVKKIQIYYAEPDKLKYTRTKQAISQNMNSTLFIKPGCGFAETVEGRVDLLQRDVKHFVSAHYLPKFVELFKQSCVQNTL